MAKSVRVSLSVRALRYRVTRPGLARDSLITYFFTGLILFANLGTGVLVARLLGPSGRGEVTAIANAAAFLSLFFLLGSREAMAYHQARHPEEGGRLLGTWLVLMVPASILAIVVSELLLPVLFSAQTAHATRLGMLYLFAGIPLALLSERITGFLLGDHDFLFWNVTRFGQPVVLVVSYVALWQADAFGVESALIALVASNLLMCIMGAVRIIGRHGLSRPSRRIGRTTIWYGLKGTVGDALALMNTRLDLLILPAVLAAASVGYYSVSTNVSWIIFMVATPITSLVLPVSARQGNRGPGTVLKVMHVTLAVGAVIAITVGVLAAVAVKAVYGADFGPSILPLRLLLPGTVIYGTAMVMTSGLYGAGRPFGATISQLAGLVVTGVGLALFLQRGGIVAAAIVSTASYAVVFMISATLYRRAANLRWRDFILPFKGGSLSDPPRSAATES